MQNWNQIGLVQLWDTINQTGEWFADLTSFVESRSFRHVSERLGDESVLDKIDKGVPGQGGFYRYLLRDECGLIIPMWRIKDAAFWAGLEQQGRNTHYDTWIWRRPWRPWKQYEYRCDPVPHIRCFRGGNSYYRSVGTFNERRENDFCNDYDEDARFYGVRARAARTSGNLPEPWDDIGRSDWGHRSWKRHRRTQWRKRK